ncbi:MAG: hypothetical protein WKG01_23115 [Kofleriaceae bacterium]
MAATRVVALAMLPLGRCQALFELEAKTVEIETVTGTLVEARVVNGPGGVPMRTDQLYPAETIAANAYFDDGTD